MRNLHEFYCWIRSELEHVDQIQSCRIDSVLRNVYEAYYKSIRPYLFREKLVDFKEASVNEATFNFHTHA